MKTSKKIRVIGCVVALMMTLCMLFGMATPVSATEESVRAAANGVFYFGIEYNGIFQGHGSCFLINKDTIITANHCVHSTQQEADLYGVSLQELDRGKNFTVTIARDFKIKASLINSSENMDFAILKLEQPINNREPLALRDSHDVKAAEKAYSLGFPASKDSTTDTAKYYNENDIIIESGTVNRAQYTEDRLVGSGNRWFAFHFVGDVIQLSSGTSSGGNSGGPMVDENGYVIGVVSHGRDAVEASCYASAISQVIEVLDALGIEYHLGGQQVPPPTVSILEQLKTAVKKAEKYDADEYTKKSFAALEDAIDEANEVLDSQSEKDAEAALENLNDAIGELEPIEPIEEPTKKRNDSDDEKEINWVLIAIIAGGALLLIAVVIAVIIIAGKGKKQPEEAPQAAVPPPVIAGAAVPPQISYGTGTTVAPQGSNETTVLSGDGGETTVLSGDGGETTVLSKQVNGGKLIRTSNNEVIPITYSGFTVGKKRKEVDYCVSDNTNVSRNHAKFIVRDGSTFIVDNKSTNGTFVNNSTVRPGDEVALNDGDMIMLADEKFEYKK